MRADMPDVCCCNKTLQGPLFLDRPTFMGQGKLTQNTLFAAWAQSRRAGCG